MEISVIISSLNNCIFASTRSIAILTNFLTDDVGLKNISSMINWIENDENTTTTSNYSYIRKHKDKIYIYFLYDGYELEENNNRDKLETTKKELINILNQWENTLKIKQKNYVYIKNENSNFFMTSK